ncbi:Alkaline phosphatase-like, alpha/beta/alpha [Syntrophomonas zehnderi OL-4]|uniref:Alkaline phosphatase-like, alpha/beta/alpha n=1 Tax=Syntrophomonas zehnderi OL-4 TaxID=690567 RepID=A0A0E3W3B3_9FIRM|nr:hypothetical protein [Syntrophomonas zehnderi]CFX69388.1 Alkaline phosphatase-like, alpha/beta/alpha [Syntrophomonas zehnderi OL-4]
MSRVYSYILVWFVLCLTFTCFLATGGKASAEETSPVKHVFLISVGGLNSEGFADTATVNMNYLAGEGVLDRHTMAVRADTLESAETSLLTGAEPTDHKHYTVNDSVEVESIFDVLNKNKRSILVVDGSGGKLQSFAYSNQGYRKIKLTASSKVILEEAYNSFQKSKPFFNYIYVDDCSDVLLRQDQKSYYAAIRKFDIELGEFLKKLQASGVYKESLIIVTSARSSSPSHQVPLIMSGPGVKVNTIISGSMIIDVASTVCQLADLKVPANSRGIPAYTVFNVPTDQKEKMYEDWIKDLKKDRLANWDMNYKLNDELGRTIRQMTDIKEEKQSIFDFAGEREQLIASLKKKLSLERGLWGGVVILMLLGYGAEYIWLRRKFLLFK